MQQAVLGGDKMIAASVDDTATSIDGGILTPRSVASSITLDHEHAKNAHEIQEQAPKMTCKHAWHIFLNDCVVLLAFSVLSLLPIILYSLKS